MGALMGIGKMAAMMDIPCQEAVRIQGHTATMNTENDSAPKLTIFLDSGSMLKSLNLMIWINTLSASGIKEKNYFSNFISRLWSSLSGAPKSLRA